jgi:restriction endonuclease Mrr
MTGYFSLLRKFNLDDEEVSVRELGAYLRTRFSDIYKISPRRLEELVEDVFKNLGYRTRLTQQTRDGGADIFLLDAGALRQAIVEVKRYAPEHPVGVQLVRQLLGAQILLAARKSYLVTTSSFTSDALSASDSPRLRENDLEVELWDGLRLLRELSCYNERILPIDSIKPDVPLHEQIPPELRARKRLVRAPWPGFYGKRVSYLEGTDQLL